MGSIPGLAQWVKDLVLLWLWCRLAATALIRPLAWEPPHAVGAALKSKKKERDLSPLLNTKTVTTRGTKNNSITPLREECEQSKSLSFTTGSQEIISKIDKLRNGSVSIVYRRTEVVT